MDEMLYRGDFDAYDLLSAATDAAKHNFNSISSRIKAIEARLLEISTLQKHIGAYSKTRDIYRQYRESGWSKKFYATHEQEIESCKAAKKYFDSLGLTKLPSMQSLRQEYAALHEEKKKLWQSHKPAREEMIALLMSKQNVDRLLGEPRQSAKTHERDAL